MNFFNLPWALTSPCPRVSSICPSNFHFIGKN